MTAVKTITGRLAGPLRSAAFIVCAAVGASSEALALDLNLGIWQSVAGSGTIKTETRDVSGFTGIALAVHGSVEIQQGSTEGVTIETDDNILPLIETVVENATLKIRRAAPNKSFSTKHVKIVVRAKNLGRLDIAGSGEMHAETLKAADLKAGIAGSGDMRIKSLEADALTVSIAGSGDVEVAGRAASMRASISGSGGIMAGKLEAKAVETSIAGSGDANVWARNTLTVSVAGSGDVSYYGDPQLQKSIRGSGAVKRLGPAP